MFGSGAAHPEKTDALVFRPYFTVEEMSSAHPFNQNHLEIGGIRRSKVRRFTDFFSMLSYKLSLRLGVGETHG